MQIITLKSDLLKTADLDQTVIALKNGKIICYPTETFYALGIDPQNPTARLRLYDLKRRLPEKDLPMIAADFDMVSRISDTSSGSIRKLADRFWPGPLTIVLYSRDHKNTFAIRVSSHPVARQISQALGVPVISTSANVSGQPALQDPAGIPAVLSDGISILIHGGTTTGGPPSTIVTMTEDPPRVLREGAISASEILATI